MSESEEEPSKNMSGDVIRRNLAEFSRNAEGSGFAYTKLDLSNREFENISEELSGYQQMKFINFSGNKMSNLIVLSRLPNIVRLEMSGNRISTLEFFNNEETFLNLQYLDLSRNMIRNLTSIKAPKLLRLNLSYNEIINTDQFIGHPNLKVLELRSNKITYVTGIKAMPRLEELYLSENNISNIENFEDLGQLKKLHLRKNNFSYIDEEKLPDLVELQYLNVRDNMWKDLNKLVVFKKFAKLKKIVVCGNPLWTSPEVVKEILVFMPGIQSINKQQIGDMDRQAAYNIAAERFSIAEAARKEAERKAQEAADKDKD